MEHESSAFPGNGEESRKRKRESHPQPQPQTQTLQFHHPVPQNNHQKQPQTQQLPHVKNPWIDLSPQAPLPPGWEQCLDLQSGQMYFLNWATQTRTLEDPRKMLQSKACDGMQLRPQTSIGLDLEMRLPSYSTNSQSSIAQICSNTPTGSSFNEMNQSNVSNPASNMAAIVCPHCHTFVMVSRIYPHCPNCKHSCNVEHTTTGNNYPLT